ncbi:MAG: molybdenum cofactor biosynthesis protein MoaE [Deltaproteobacteria bacterium]|nr:molybdenum cofactor biosynthesis protein MoaE [Deltaproteobacteria bacterium]
MESRIQVTDQKIDVHALEEWGGDPSCGATLFFVGKVRNEQEGRLVLSLEYTAYVEMAVGELKEIVREVERRWDVRKCAVVHRIGTLQVGDVAVAIVISSVHRREAFEACQYLIDTLKERVPIWKREEYEDGKEWVHAECCRVSTQSRSPQNA